MKERIVNIEVTLIVRCRYDTDMALEAALLRLVAEIPFIDVASNGSDGRFSLKTIRTKLVEEGAP